MHTGTAALKAGSRGSAFARAAATARMTPKSLKNSTVRRPPVNRELIARRPPAGAPPHPTPPANPPTTSVRLPTGGAPPGSAAAAVAAAAADHSDIEHYRRLAAETFVRRDRLLAQSKAAFLRGEKLAAVELAGEARTLFSAAAHYNRLAAERIFRHHNPSLETDVVDLHGLYVQEAVYYFSAHMQRCIARGESRVTCVVGRGKNTAVDGGSRLLPAVWALCEQLDVHAECAGAGVLTVRVDLPFDASLAGPTLHHGW